MVYLGVSSFGKRNVNECIVASGGAGGRALSSGATLSVFAYIVCLVLCSCTVYAQGADDDGSDALSAALAAVPRVLSPGEDLPCGELPLVRYGGSALKYQRVARVHPAFVARLRAFEALVSEVALAYYGRPPRRLVHLGTYNCRRMRTYPTWVSEHALGNAIDLAGFDFGPLKRGEVLPDGVPVALRRPFQVRIEAHFKRRRGVGRYHARFLHALTRALIARPELFPVVLGPGWPGHHNHLHLDGAPYRAVEVDFPDVAD